MKRKTLFTWREWSYTGSDENLFDLDKESLKYFKLIVKEAL